jgi:hypothetical protein
MLFKYCRYRFPAPPGKAAFEGRGGPFHSSGNERIAADSPACLSWISRTRASSPSPALRAEVRPLLDFSLPLVPCNPQ